MGIIFSSDDERIANNYFDAINDLIGVAAVGLGVTAWQFEHPIPIAIIFSVIILLWSFSKGEEFDRIKNHYLPQGAPLLARIRFFWRIRVYLFGMSFLLSVACGMTTKCGLYRIFGYACV